MTDIHAPEFLSKLCDSAEEFARKGGDSTKNYFKKSFELNFKEDQTPVTTADREAEAIIREAIHSRYPNHGIVGEEYGSEGEGKDIVWVIDPIDGTQSFIHGVPFYTTLIGILVEGVSEVGIIYAPALDEMVSASTGSGTHLNGKPCKSRICNEIEDATFLTSDTRHVYEYGYRRGYEELLERTRLHRTWGDAYGHMMVATGRADFMFDPVLNLWDAAALLPVVQEAGAVFSDVDGERRIDSGSAISCAAGIHKEVLEILNP